MDFLTHPLEAFKKSREDDMRSVIRFYFAFLLANAVLTALASLTGVGIFGLIRRSLYIHNPVIIFFLVILSGIIGIPLLGAWLHLWVYIAGGRKGFTFTLKAVMYGSTPVLLLSWIPFIGIIFYLWGVILTIFGIHEVHEIDGDQAAFAVIVPIVIVVVIIVLLIARLFLAGVLTNMPLTRFRYF
ncbi:MAG: Yip1 family protein [Methanoregula sp.]